MNTRELIEYLSTNYYRVWDVQHHIQTLLSSGKLDNYTVDEQLLDYLLDKYGSGIIYFITKGVRYSKVMNEQIIIKMINLCRKGDIYMFTEYLINNEALSDEICKSIIIKDPFIIRVLPEQYHSLDNMLLAVKSIKNTYFCWDNKKYIDYVDFDTCRRLIGYFKNQKVFFDSYCIFF